MKKIAITLLGLISLVSSTFAGPPGPKDNKLLYDQCRTIALTLDGLSRYQDRAICNNLLAGLPVYEAAFFISNNQYDAASDLLRPVVVKVNFAIDIGCYGQNDMKKVVQDTQKILNALSN